MLSKPHVFLVGGFLGAGKTTAIIEACAYLEKQKINVAVITNDQGHQLVDTAFIRSHNILASEVTGGCFCCNYAELAEGIDLFELSGAEVIFAESVGSCADIVATVVKPLLRARPDIHISFAVFAEATVLYSQWHSRQFLFQKNVHYIYDKQLEEADMIVISKADLLDAEKIDKVFKLAQLKYPGKPIRFQNNLLESDISDWISSMAGQSLTPRKSLDIDYLIYGDGEAQLSWLDATLQLKGVRAFYACDELVSGLCNQVTVSQWPIGHLKFFIDDGGHQVKISYFTGGNLPVLTGIPEEGQTMISIMINARIQCTPDEIQGEILSCIDMVGQKFETAVTITTLECFTPGFPRPTHRIFE